MSSSSWLQRARGTDLAIVGWAFALLVLWAPMLSLGLLTPRMALVFAGLGPGLVVVVGLARRGDRAAQAAVAFLAWALVCVALSRHPALSFIGGYGTDIGWVYLAGYLAAWGLGRRLTLAGRQLLIRVLLAGIGLNIVFAVLESAFEPGGKLASNAGRVQGLLSNSLFLAGVLAGALALVGVLLGRREASGSRRWEAIAYLAAATTAVLVTGSRAAFVGGAALAVAGAFLGARRIGGDRAVAGRAAGWAAAAIVVGLLLSIPLQSSSSSTSRLDDVSASSGGYESRATMWSIGLEELAHRPIQGYGPGRFREATEPSTPASFVLAEGPDKPFYDAHNLFVEVAVTTGIVGLGLAIAFGVGAARRARGPLAWFAMGVAVTWLFNPLSVCTAPVALLALGAASRRPVTGVAPGGDDDDTAAPAAADDKVPVGAETVPGLVGERAGAWPPVRLGAGAGTAVGAVLCLIGVVAGARLLVADALVEQASTTGDTAVAAHAAALIPWDATLAGLEAQGAKLDVFDDPSAANRAVAVAAARRPTELDPTRATWWVRKGLAEAAFGTGTRDERLDRAQRDFDRALERNPWSLEALVPMHAIAVERHDGAEAARLRAKLCRIDACPED